MRRVTNEPQVEAALTNLGFRIFDNAEHSIKQQVKAFQNASLIVGPHGAGLTNIVYTDRGTPVVEIVPEGYNQGVTSYRSLSDLFELSYRQLFALEVRPDRKGNRCNSDIEIDIHQLIGVIEELRN
jgi:capsular polysaccharide biosynthesis protein